MIEWSLMKCLTRLCSPQTRLGSSSGGHQGSSCQVHLPSCVCNTHTYIYIYLAHCHMGHSCYAVPRDLIFACVIVIMPLLKNAWPREIIIITFKLLHSTNKWQYKGKTVNKEYYTNDDEGMLRNNNPLVLFPWRSKMTEFLFVFFNERIF